MSYLRLCTLTGLDEATDLKELARVAADNALSEWGVLFSRGRMAEDGGKGRYPREQWIREFAAFAEENKIRTALHLCGNDAVEFMRSNAEIQELAGQFGRVQLNVKADGVKVKDLDVRAITNSIRGFFGYGWNAQSVIFQYNDSNREFCQEIQRSSCRGFEALVDASGGRGVTPANWKFRPHEFMGMCIGFAGGLGPDNIAEQLPLIAEGADRKPFWIDMESKLRSSDDKFDLAACEQVLKEVARWQHDLIAKAAAEAHECDRPETDVAKLDGLYLDWWAGLASGYPMVIPPQHASRPMYLSRTYGDYTSFQPSQNAHQLNDLVEELGVGCIRKPGTKQWTGMTTDGQSVVADERDTAMLRAVVLEAFGPKVPSNLADEPFLHSVWLGEGAGARAVAEHAAAARKTRP